MSSQETSNKSSHKRARELLSGLDSQTVEQLAVVKVVSFDLDDTLWPLEQTIMEAERKQYEWIQANAADVATQLDQRQVIEKRREYVEQHPHLKGDVTAMRKQSLAALFAEHGYAAADAASMVEEVFDVFYQARSQVTLFDDAMLCLEDLRKSFKLAAITNGNADLEIAGIHHLFDDIHCATLDSPPKPDAFMFNACARALQVTPSEILHVGDNVETDVGGGRLAGTLTAWYNPGELPWPEDLPGATMELQTLAELPAVMQLVAQ